MNKRVSPTEVEASAQPEGGRSIWSLHGRLGRTLLVMAGAILLLAVWEFSVTWGRLPSYILPSPEKVVQALFAGLNVPISSRIGFYVPMASTVSNAAAGLIIGGVLGVILGSLMAEYRPLETMLMPYTFALQTLPKVAIAPLIIIWFGFGDSSKIAMAALLAFFPLMVNTFTGLRTVDPGLIDLMRSLSASRFETYRIVRLPAAAPYLVAGLDMAVVYALLGTLIAEFLGAQEGIGVTITKAQAATDVASVFAALILLGIIGILLHLAVRAVDNTFVHWVKRNKV